MLSCTVCVVLERNSHTDGEVILIGASGTDIVRLQVSSQSITTVYRSNQFVSSLNYDVKQRRLMWLENGRDAIYSYTKYGIHTMSAKSVLVAGLTSITTFTYDWITESFVWCSEAERRVYITSLNGAQHTLLQLPDSLVPSSVAIDPFRQ